MAKSKKPTEPWPHHYKVGDVYHVRPQSLQGVGLDNLIVLETKANDDKQAAYVFIQMKHTVSMTATLMKATATAFSESTPAPVYRPSLILDLFVPYDRAQDMHANLGELYPVWVERHGVGRANFIRSCQVAWLIGGTWWEKLLSTAERMLKVFRTVGF